MLAGGIAHELNNILAAIIMFSELAMTRLPEGTQAEKMLQRVLEAGARGTAVVEQVLAFGRREKPDLKVIPAESFVQEAVEFLRASIPPTVEMRLNLPPDCGAILADPAQMQQVVVNLCTNAYQAMKSLRGLIEIGLSRVEVDSRLARQYVDLQAGPYVKLTVRDNGEGIEPAVQERMFEPFFTTKEVGKGTGLGLSVVHGIVKSHGGTLSVESKPGEGTEVVVYLPRTKTAASDQEEVVEAAPRGSEHILYVDDEERLVQAARLMLEDRGYKVTTRTDSMEALSLFRAHAESFDLVISDVAMPKMNGVELAALLTEMRPDMPIILATGLSDLIEPQEAKRKGVIRELMTKPFGILTLAQTVRRVLDPTKE